jgi:hypothetical protein
MISVLEKKTAPAAAKKPALGTAEVERRVAILKRFRELLSQQRNHFRQYLEVLDNQKNIIEQGSADQLIAHVDLEEKIVSDIFAIQKVIDPLEEMYQASLTAAGGIPAAIGGIPVGAAGSIGGELPAAIPSLRTTLEELRGEAVIRSKRNRNLLAKRMEELRQEMKNLRANPYAIHRSAFSQESAALIDIKG